MRVTYTVSEAPSCTPAHITMLSCIVAWRSRRRRLHRGRRWVQNDASFFPTHTTGANSQNATQHTFFGQLSRLGSQCAGAGASRNAADAIACYISVHWENVGAVLEEDDAATGTPSQQKRDTCSPKMVPGARVPLGDPLVAISIFSQSKEHMFRTLSHVVAPGNSKWFVRTDHPQ